MTLVEVLAKQGFEWVPAPKRNPVHPLLSAKRVGNVVYVSGQVPIEDGTVIAGKVGDGDDLVAPSRAQHAAKLCALACLYAAGSVIDPENIVGVVAMTVYVNCAPGFIDTSSVANGASDFLIAIFGEQGEHTRDAIGAAELPLNAAVEIKAVFEVR